MKDFHLTTVSLGLLQVVFAVLILFTSCGKVPRLVRHTGTAEQADSTMQAAYKQRDYKGMLQMADSFEAAGVLSDVKANYWRGYACSRMRQLRRADEQPPLQPALFALFFSSPQESEDDLRDGEKREQNQTHDVHRSFFQIAAPF